MTCQIDIFSQDIGSQIHLTFVREWTRNVLGNEAVKKLDDGLRDGKSTSVPKEIDDAIQYCMMAMDAGQVVPGAWRDSDGTCRIDWPRMACFANWYMAQNDKGRESIRQAMQGGDGAPWIVHGSPNAMTYCVSESEHEGCCKSDVWADSAYTYLSDPVEEEKPFWSWWKMGLAAVTLGIGAAVIQKRW